MLSGEALLESICLLNELLFLVNLVRKHLEIKLKEVLGFLVLVLLWLVDLLPQLANVGLDLLLGSLVVVALVLEVPDDEEQLFLGALTK